MAIRPGSGYRAFTRALSGMSDRERRTHIITEGIRQVKRRAPDDAPALSTFFYVVGNTTKKIYKYDINGDLVWASIAYTSPVIRDVGAGKVFITDGAAKHFVAIDSVTGVELWNVDPNASYDVFGGAINTLTGDVYGHMTSGTVGTTYRLDTDTGATLASRGVSGGSASPMTYNEQNDILYAGLGANTEACNPTTLVGSAFASSVLPRLADGNVTPSSVFLGTTSSVLEYDAAVTLVTNFTGVGATSTSITVCSYDGAGNAWIANTVRTLYRCDDSTGAILNTYADACEGNFGIGFADGELYAIGRSTGAQPYDIISINQSTGAIKSVIVADAELLLYLHVRQE